VNENEWTVEDVMKLGGTGKVHDIARAHNAALAAERENTRRWAFEAHESAKSEQQLRKQLAAEREKLIEMEKDRDRWRDMAHGEPTKRPAWDKR
jgi:hypothetical protein